MKRKCFFFTADRGWCFRYGYLSKSSIYTLIDDSSLNNNKIKSDKAALPVKQNIYSADRD